MFQYLAYGLIGFSAILATLTFRLLREELRRKPSARKTALTAIYVYMAFALALCTVGFVYEMWKPVQGVVSTEQSFIPPSPEDFARARETAESFAALLDAGKWPEAYSATSDIFKSLVPRAMWDNMTLQYRGYGGLVKRQLVRTDPGRIMVPGGPVDVIGVVFQCVYESKPLGNEIITVKKGDSGRHEVVGFNVM